VTTTETLSPADRAFLEGVRWRDASCGQGGTEEDLLRTLSAHRVRWDQSRLYYEAHITLTPLEEHQQKLLTVLLAYGGGVWRQSTFVMETDGPTPAAFLSSRSASLIIITEETRRMVEIIRDLGLEVTRYKIEDTLLDSRRGDVL